MNKKTTSIILMTLLIGASMIPTVLSAGKENEKLLNVVVDTHTISGEITYEGELGSNTIYVYEDYLGLVDTIASKSYGVSYYSFDVPNGRYYVSAFMDENGNEVHDDGEQIGKEWRIDVANGDVIVNITMSPTNKPTAPTYILPEDGAVDIQVGKKLIPLLSWNPSTDPDCDEVFYRIHLSPYHDPGVIVKIYELTELNFTIPINSYWVNKDIYWKIVACTWDGAESSGPIWSFHTEGVPYEPRNPSPEDGATNILLNSGPIVSWETGHPVPLRIKHHIYFGTDPNPPLCVETDWFDLNDENYHTYTENLGMCVDLQYDTTYYWKIITEDYYHAYTEGPVWSFTTEESEPLYNISGTIYYDGTEEEQIGVLVFSAEDDIGVGDPVGIAMLDEPGDYSILVPNGEYYVLSIMNVSGDDEPNILIDPIGIAINKTIFDFLYNEDIIDIIEVNDSDVDDVDITLYGFHDFDNVFGEIYYDGGETGQIYLMVIHEDEIPEIPGKIVNGQEPEFLMIPVEIGDYGIYLPTSDTWYLAAFMDVDGNGLPTMEELVMEPFGIAINRTFIDFMMNGEIDPINAPMNGVDITLFDLYTISGTIYYDGDENGKISIGVFDGIDINNLEPLYGMPVNEIIDGKVDYVIPSYSGEYYIGSFMDVNGNSIPDFSIDPFGFAINKTLPAADKIEINGHTEDIDITLHNISIYDIDFDGKVDPFDMINVMSHFGCKVGIGNVICDRCDVNGDGVVDPFDSNLVMEHFGS